jgi:hypothetical protein
MTLLIETPHTYTAERRYTLSVLLNEFLGLDIDIKCTERNNVRITADNKRELIIADVFFTANKDSWLKPGSLPKQPLEIWEVPQVLSQVNLINPQLPVIYGMRLHNGDFVQISDKRIDIGLDILGSAFFMMTRYEEAVKSDRDEFDRFPSTASLAYQESFLDRPIINEYLEILWWAIKKLWSNIERKKREFKIAPSHDVDNIFQSFGSLTRNMAGDILKRRAPAAAINRFTLWAQNKRCFSSNAPLHIFNWLMDTSEESNQKSAFFFIPDKCGRADPDYALDNKHVKNLMGIIHQRGHEIGYHGSFATYQDAGRTKEEFKHLLNVSEELGIKQAIWGGRHHYLRWDARCTWRNWEFAGLNYDTTLSFADHAGFRCGICYEYSVFDLIESKPLALVERPLIVMESTVFSKKYMNLGKSGVGLELIKRLKERCRMFNGNFTLLWHNNELLGESERTMYIEILKS